MPISPKGAVESVATRPNVTTSLANLIGANVNSVATCKLSTANSVRDERGFAWEFDHKRDNQHLVSRSARWL